VRHVEGTLAGQGGVRLHTDRWDDDRATRGVIAISHGASEHARRYAHVAERLVAAGFAVYALDHRGHGESTGPRAVIDSMDAAVADLDALVDRAVAERPGLPVFLLGHSLGGLIATEYALRHQDRLAGLVLSSAALTMAAASPATRLISRVLSRFAPSLGVFEIETEGISRDLEEVRKYEADPLVHHGKLPVRTVAEAAAVIDSLPARTMELRLPMLVIHGELDPIVPLDGSRKVHELAASEDKTLRIYPGLYHEMFNELAEDRERVLGEVVEWLQKRAGAG
jgi:lysophospholipase